MPLPIEANQKSIFDYPSAPLNSNEWPVATIISICFIAIWIILITVLKIMFSSTSQHFSDNKYDLVIFKPLQKNTLIPSRKLFENNTVLKNNIKAMTESEFDITNIPISVNYYRKLSVTSIYSVKF
ncbi:unnamed protein product [Brachionus calyciflorus]|uniref:Uncharacterized protein n=1 Tax=Brachionus calyciflorus TaxID=104777 RepID=A0A813MHJ4_9BILA|nr:unnamed protein product [Brachionus calyciflorus]